MNVFLTIVIIVLLLAACLLLALNLLHIDRIGEP